MVWITEYTHKGIGQSLDSEFKNLGIDITCSSAGDKYKNYNPFTTFIMQIKPHAMFCIFLSCSGIADCDFENDQETNIKIVITVFHI